MILKMALALVLTLALALVPTLALAIPVTICSHHHRYLPNNHARNCFTRRVRGSWAPTRHCPPSLCAATGPTLECSSPAFAEGCPLTRLTF